MAVLGTVTASYVRIIDIRLFCQTRKDLMKWAMLRSNMWTREYDVSIESRLEEIFKYQSDDFGDKFNTRLNSWSSGDSSLKPISQAKSSDYQTDMDRTAEKAEPQPESGNSDWVWIEDAFDPKGRVTPDDYSEWLEALQKQCLNKNTSNVLKVLNNLGSIDDQKVDAVVFNGTFYSIWRDPPPQQNQMDMMPSSRQTETPIGPKYRDYIIQGLSSIIRTEQVPDHVHSVFLDLANFIEHCDADKESISTFGASLQAFGGADGIKALGDCAEKVSAYAKALHYREMEFMGCLITPHDETKNKTRIAENLINIYSKLNATEAAEGVLDYAQANGINVSAQWYEKLNHWSDAKERYNNALAVNSNEANNLGYMRCLEALGEWDTLETKTRDFMRPLMDADELPSHQARLSS